MPRCSISIAPSMVRRYASRGVGRQRRVGRGLEEHEQLERQAADRALEVVRRRVEVRVDQAGHQQLPTAALDDPRIGAVRRDRCRWR